MSRIFPIILLSRTLAPALIRDTGDEKRARRAGPARSRLPQIEAGEMPRFTGELARRFACLGPVCQKCRLAATVLFPG